MTEHNECLNCGKQIDSGERFCSPKCRKKYENVKANELVSSDTDLPRAITDDIELYAEAEDLDQKEALIDLLIFAIKVRLPQLDLKPVAPRINPAKSVLEKELEGVDLDLQLSDLE